MNVLHLTTHLNSGGITIYILRLIKPLAKLGVDLHVLSSGGDWTSNFRELGAATYDLPIKTKSEVHPKIYWAIPSILRIIREKKIDLLHAHTRITQVQAFWIQKLTGIPVVTTCHGFYQKRIGRRLIPAWGDRAIAISQPVQDDLIQGFKLPPQKTIVIYNGIDTDSFNEAYQKHDPIKVRRDYGFGMEDPVVGIVARLVGDKGHKYLMEAAHQLRRDFPRIRLLIVGDGRERAELDRCVQRLELQDHVVFTSNVKDVTQPLSAMNVFAFPATWREGFGLSIVEAMACGKPVIVTNIWALNSLIQDRVNGLMVEPRKVEPLAEAIKILLSDENYRRKIAAAGRKMVEESFSVQRMAQEIKSVYESVLRTPQNFLTGQRQGL